MEDADKVTPNLEISVFNLATVQFAGTLKSYGTNLRLLFCLSLCAMLSNNNPS